MLWRYISYCCPSFVLLSLILWAMAGYAYRVNAKRAADDPKKRSFHPVAFFLAPITWPLLLFGILSLFALRALVYGVFLILFTIALLAFRKSFLLVWLEKLASYIGNKLLEANSFLIKIAFGDWEESPQPI